MALRAVLLLIQDRYPGDKRYFSQDFHYRDAIFLIKSILAMLMDAQTCTCSSFFLIRTSVRFTITQLIN